MPGLAELEAAIGVRVNDVSVASEAGISVDAGENVGLHLSLQKQFIKGDFEVRVEVMETPIPIPVGPIERAKAKLPLPGMFIVDRQGDVPLIVHRSRDLAIHTTPVKIDDAGKLFLDRPTWTAVHMQPYDDIDALVQALQGMNLTLIK